MTAARVDIDPPVRYGGLEAGLMRVLFATLAVLLLAQPIPAQERWTPARLETGSPPPTPVLSVAGGEVFLEVTVTAAGVVGRIDPLRTTPPFTDVVFNTVRGWRFQPAERTREMVRGNPPVRELVTEKVESKVLVAAIYRPPALQGPTHGEAPRDVGKPTSEVAFPRSATTPLFPVQALFDGTVLLEVAIGADGRVTDAAVVQSGPGFDRAALDAARRWSFEPARVEGRTEATFAYLVMAFRQPITTGTPERPPQQPRPPQPAPGPPPR